MFAVIETKGATHIAINIPKEGADKSLPALAAMLEYNATFIQKGWRELNIVKPAMSIVLGNSYNAEDAECGEITIQAEREALDESFHIASPEILISNKKAIAKKEEEIKRLRAELDHTKEQLRESRSQVEALTSVE